MFPIIATAAVIPFRTAVNMAVTAIPVVVFEIRRIFKYTQNSGDCTVELDQWEETFILVCKELGSYQYMNIQFMLTWQRYSHTGLAMLASSNDKWRIIF